MRKIPVLINGDESKLVGWLLLEDTISDEQVADCTVSWGFLHENRLREMSLVPRLQLMTEAQASCSACGKSRYTCLNPEVDFIHCCNACADSLGETHRR